ncbi:hypothetical protein VTJ83DRAFT_7460 [Remersonia thermophila]|uniref:U3 small nucleolar ribonucleoprotein protein MPP10 n=1 Tax=Remersonia thermophila TaxID=72144 RepID=A0ABR4D3Q2_9PEZI
MATPSDPSDPSASANANATAVAVFLDSTFPSNRHVFLRPSPLLPAGSLQIAKDTLDGLAAQVADQQLLRLREAAGKKRKRDGAAADKTAPLKMRRVHVDGFETGQVWQQAKKIITSALAESEQILAELEAADQIATGAAADAADDDEGSGVSEEEDESASGDEFDEVSDQEAGVDVEIDDDDDDDLSEEADLDEEEEEEEEEEEDQDEDAASGAEEGQEEGYDDEPQDEYVEDPFGLNDGFFSIDEFNKQTQWFEDQDARGDPNTDVLSEDDESVDWHADPFAPKKKNARRDDDDADADESDEGSDDEEELGGAGLSKEDLAKQLDAESSEDDEGGNLEDDVADMGLDLSADDIYYKDFFAPPKKKKKPGHPPKRPGAAKPFRPDDADVERAENDVRRDLFEDLSERSDDDDDNEDALSDVSAGDPRSRRSAHERRQAKIAEEIRRLEAELVAKRAWTLSGEAKAADRPVNSLLEEDLDFEHVGKPVPVATEDVSESIEELIKRRILANEFDEVLRRRPDALGNPGGARRGLVDVDDTKAKQSLADIYEEEHVKKANPDAYVSAADDKLRRDEEEIRRMWTDISARLDALSSWHYKPKPAAPTLTVVSDVATVAMEDAQPTTAQGVAAGESMIAPQEVYAPGKAAAEKGEVVAKSGLPVAKEEMTREEKLRRRRREKERIRKAGGLHGRPATQKEQERKETLASLKKGGVKVINRKGEVVGMDGKKVAEGKGPQSGGAFKL